jgi:hypothetical protein
MIEHRHVAPWSELASATLASAAWRRSSRSGSQGNCVEAALLGGAKWRKSSRSGSSGECVEAAVLGSARWHKSSHSGSEGNCIEVTGDLPGAVAVRDSKNPGEPALVFSRDEWTAFIGELRRREPGRS